MNGHVTRNTSALGLVAAVFALAAPKAHAAISLELRPSFQSTFVGATVSVDLYAVSDLTPGQTFGAAQMVLTWNTAFVQLLGIDNTGTPLTGSGFFPGDPFGINASMTDGDAWWNGFAPAGGVPVALTGTFLTSFDFTALNPTVVPTLIGLPPTGGNGGFTAVYNGTGNPDQDITGSLTGALVEIVLPSPGALGALLVGLMCAGGRRRQAVV